MRVPIILICTAALSLPGGAVRNARPSEGPQAGPEAAEGPTAVPRPFVDLVRGTPLEQRVLSRAYQLAVRECMESHGFQYAIAEAAVPAAQERPDVPGNAYGFVSPANAHAAGYGIDGPEQVVRPDQNRSYLDSLKAEDRQAWGDALTGSAERMQAVVAMREFTISEDPAACTSVARAKVYGAREWVHLYYWAQLAAYRVAEQTRADPRFTLAREHWRQCMAEAGYHVGPEVGSAQTYVRDAPGDETVNAELERTVAQHDAACLVAADLWRVASEVQASYEQAARLAHKKKFDELARLGRAAVARAEKRIRTASR